MQLHFDTDCFDQSATQVKAVSDRLTRVESKHGQRGARGAMDAAFVSSVAQLIT